jgi:hypothetical protein
MSDQEFNNPPEIPPVTGDVPPSPTKRGRKPNGAGRVDEPGPSPDESRSDPPIDIKPGSGPDGETTPEDLDEDAAEFARLRRDLPHVEGAATLGITGIAVVKAPPKNVFFRAHKGFRPIVDLVTDQVKLDQRYYAVHPRMAPVLTSIGIAYAAHTLYLIITPTGAYRVIPVRCPDGDGDRNEYASSKELGLRQSVDGWVRIYTDLENSTYRVFPAPIGRFPEPVWPEIPDAKIFRLCFRDRGYLIDTPDHPRFIDWVGRKPKDDGQG